MRYDAYLFDLYGTLVDIHTDESSPRFWKRAAALFAARGACYAPEELHAAYLDGIRSQPPRGSFAVPEPDLAPVFADLLAQKGAPSDAAAVAKTAWAFRQASVTHLRLYSGAKALLAALRMQGRVILLSNAQRLFTMPELEKLGLSDAFDAVLLSSDYGCKKPDPAFFRIPLAEFRLDPSRCLMIGNDPFCDVCGAADAGMDTLFLRTALSPKGVSDAPATYAFSGMDLRRVQRLLTGTNGKMDKSDPV